MKSFASESFDDSSLPTYVGHETLEICEEEPTIMFVPCPPPFPEPIWVPPDDDVEVGKFENRIVSLSVQPSSNSHYSNLIEEDLEWFSNYTEPEVKFDPLVFQVHNPILESNPTEIGISSRSTIYIS